MAYIYLRNNRGMVRTFNFDNTHLQEYPSSSGDGDDSDINCSSSGDGDDSDANCNSSSDGGDSDANCSSSDDGEYGDGDE